MTTHLKNIFQDKTNVLILVITLLSISTIGTRFTLIGIVLQMILIGICLPLPVLLSGLISRIVIGFLLSTGLWTIAALGFWALNVSITPSGIIILQALILIGLVIGGAGLRSIRRIRIDRSEIVISLVSLLSGALVLWGALGGGPVAQQALRHLTTGFDNMIHISVLLSDYEQRGYVYGPKEEVIETMIYPDFVSYPQGWHVSASILLQSVTSIFPNLSTTGLLVFYISLQTLWYVLLVFIFQMVVAIILRILAKKLTWQMLVSLIGLGAIVQAGIFIGLLQSGFTNFIALLVYTLLLVVVTASFIYEISNLSPKEREPRIPIYLSLSLFIGAILSLVWTLAAPIGYLSTGILIIYLTRQSSVRTMLRTLIQRPWLLMINILLALVPIVQIYFQLAYGLKPNQLNESGGIQELSYTLLLICLAVSFIWYIREKSTGMREVFLGSVAGSVLLSGGVYFYQYYTANVINYYSIKLGFITLILLLAFTLPIAILYLWKYLRDGSPLIYVVGILCLCMALPQALSLDLSRVAFATGKSRLLSPYSASQIVNEYPAILSQDTIFVVYKQLNYEEDLITTNFFRTIARSSSSCQTNQVADLLFGKHEDLINETIKCSKDRPTQKTIVLASATNYEYLAQRFSSQQNIQVLLSN